MKIAPTNQQIYKVLERITDAFVALDTNWCYTYVNKKAAKIFNRQREDLIGKHIWTEFPEGIGQPFYNAYHKAVKNQVVIHFEEYYKPWDRWFENHIYPSNDGLSIFFQDITDKKKAEQEQRQLEEQLRHAQKMEAIGTLASGLAHDINNLLAVIAGQASLIKGDLRLSKDAVNSFGLIEKAVNQAGGVTKSLLAFAKQIPSEKTQIDLVSAVSESLLLLRRLLPASIQIVEDLPTDTGVWVFGNRAQIQQVLMNLVVNARDAMPSGGTLWVGLALEHNNADQEAVLTVEDTGHGISHKTSSRIFEPFFTTKQPGKGTGLGLAVTHGIVADHGGEIRVSSRVEKGTKIQVRLKTCNEPVQLPITQTMDTPSTQSGVILLVQDDSYVQQIMESTLESSGYQVKTASNGKAAMETINNHGDQVDLVILDLDPSKKTSMRYFEQFCSKCPNLPIIFVTVNTGATSKELTHPNAHILAKPFQMFEMVDMVRQILRD